MDAILQINLIYFSPHHKNKFVNSVNSLKNSLAALAEIKKANMLDFTRSGLPIKIKIPLFCGQVIAVCSLITHLMHLSLNMLICTTNSIMIYQLSHSMPCRLHSAQRSFLMLVSNIGSAETFLPRKSVV